MSICVKIEVDDSGQISVGQSAPDDEYAEQDSGGDGGAQQPDAGDMQDASAAPTAQPEQDATQPGADEQDQMQQVQSIGEALQVARHLLMQASSGAQPVAPGDAKRIWDDEAVKRMQGREQTQ